MASSSSSTAAELDLGNPQYAEVTCGDKKVQVPTNLFINGKFVDSISKKRFETLNPATEEVICTLAEADKEDIDVAVAAARQAQPGWAAVDPHSRANLMYKLVRLVEEAGQDLAALETLDNGKPQSIALNVDHALSCQTLRYYAGFCTKICGRTLPSGPGEFNYTERCPVGVVGQIIPWNFPLLMLCWKWGPALCCGNCIVLKSAEQTPLSALYMAELAAKAGFPPGVVNVVSGYGPTAGAALASHMDVDKIAFTGSTAVGRLIMEAAAKSNLKRVSLELGGKSPVVVFADADLDYAVQQCLAGIFFNSGQVCTAGSRIFVEEGIHDAFVAKFKEAADNWTVGNGFAPETAQGPQVSQRQLDTVLGYIEAGKESGATLVCGGGRLGDKGYFVQPTLFTNVDDNAKIAREEIFGPVGSLFTFNESNINEVVRRANDTIYGLAAAVFTRDITRALTLARGINAGTVWINQQQTFDVMSPFGGFKASGFGRELGEESIELYTNVKSVRVKL
jgi:aldehyde dehydrogenase (NAD+)